jgi:hypothetical protein
MSWVITPQQVTDPDALAYLAEVERADGQALESGVRDAVIAFVVGCKADGIWNAIKASCILAGARTLTGALVPLVGAATTREGTENGWSYNRKTGLAGNGTNNRLNTNRNNNADPQNNNHNAIYQTEVVGGAKIGAAPIDTSGSNFIGNTLLGNRCNTATAHANELGLIAHSRNNPDTFAWRAGGTTATVSVSSQTPFNGNITLFSLGTSFAPNGASRFAFYSIGESLNLALLDARVTTLINAFDAAI